MKRAAAILTGATVFVMTQVGSAFAGTKYPTGHSHSPGVSGNGGTAFTGSNVSHVAIWLAVLVVVGVGALLVARRRSAGGTVTPA
ncbi:MAG: hypothetical protein QOI60_961 [Actinomycetota bacterium]|jgi:hypothetical protein|nr:hypothetical protein [Actinomycetota bacterium]MEA2581738.1 hypothetical protein [Actinomycetota bacterium]